MVSIVIPFYNRTELIERAVESALRQTHSNIEIIVVDDCSTIDVSSFLAKFSTRVVYRKLARNSGANAARNAGVAIARGEFVAMLDDDDYFVPTKIERQLSVIGDRIACLCGYFEDKRMEPRVALIPEVTEDFLRRTTVCGMSGLLCRTDWLKANLFDETLPNAQDWDVFVRISQDQPLAYAAEPLYVYRVEGSDSITAKNTGLNLEKIQQKLAAADKHREWLGRSMYRRRAANHILSHIGSKGLAASRLMLAVRICGPFAVARNIGRKAMARLPGLSHWRNASREGW
jgi:glycosyltransferase involved in cell wall biosynthesis